ncbi:GW dipeptide domain-containing protein [Gaoshiqia sediminis]|uniref:GW dipeptide domain-containing protein n=1 Tax=Gaoshiqia sediminis TaxID=2986998 RepID=A0AA41YBE2_9BACT|nr:GW dipeptide domain-containing protein [Gaoshiqia sediminis]MCW0483068.1 GW dipeptide domain-containing protein [Gaoshiqia sediminis]
MMRLIFIWIAGSMLLFSCTGKTKETVQPIDVATLTSRRVTVEEVIQTTAYTYLRVTENGKDVWMAVTKMDANAGDVYYYDNGLEMLNFESEELGRVFDRVLFVEDLRIQPNKTMSMHHGMTGHGLKEADSAREDLQLEPVAGGITIGELYKNRETYSGKKVVVTGKVVKVNKEIMNRNWVHLQDGTSHEGKFDLTFTTNESVEVNDMVTFEGTVSVDKDFGAGYFYELIVEEASLK